jgi:hypothetical protein
MPIRFFRRLLGERADATPARPVRLDLGKREESPYRAIGIWPGEPSCLGARQFAQLRFLYRSAPRLPLPECDQAECHCTYTHYSDRRSGAERRSPSGVLPPGMVDRRSGQDRRRAKAR